jgi:hypothetical protein
MKPSIQTLKKEIIRKNNILQKIKDQTRKLLMDKSQLARPHNYSQKTMT